MFPIARRAMKICATRHASPVTRSMGDTPEFTVADERFCIPIPTDTQTSSRPVALRGFDWIPFRWFGQRREALGIYGSEVAAHIIAQVAVYQGRSVTRSRAPAMIERNNSRRTSARSAGDRTSVRRKNWMLPSFVRRSARWCPLLWRRFAREARRVRRHPHERRAVVSLRTVVGARGRSARWPI